MGQKVNPHGLRVGIIKEWDSRWYADAEFSDFLVEDYNIRKFLKKKLYSAGISKIEIERASDRVKIVIYTAKPGVVIGKGGAEIEVTKKELSKLTDILQQLRLTFYICRANKANCNNLLCFGRLLNNLVQQFKRRNEWS